MKKRTFLNECPALLVEYGLKMKYHCLQQAGEVNNIGKVLVFIQLPSWN